MGILKKKLLKIVSIFIASRFPLICPNYVMENYSNILEAIFCTSILTSELNLNMFKIFYIFDVELRKP